MGHVPNVEAMDAQTQGTAPTSNPATETKSKRDLLLEKKREIEAQLRLLAYKESKRRRRAETKGKIIIGALASADKALVATLASKASERDREHLRSLGWL